MAKDLLSTREAAGVLGVGTTSIKRWADSGLLECVRTPGGHRRFPRQSVEAMLELHGGAPANDGDTDGWLRLLIDGSGPTDVYKRLIRERIALGGYVQVCEQLGAALYEMGERWQAGELTIGQEHLAVERLHRGAARACEDLVLAPDAARALLATAEGEEHTIGLSLAELVLREAGWETRWCGRRTPFAAIRGFVAAGECSLVVISASAHSADPEVLEDQASRLAELCDKHNVHLVLGGSGSWPDSLVKVHRLRSYRGLAKMSVSFLQQDVPIGAEQS